MTEVLGRRALNRATLARQMLLRRHDMPLLDALEHLVGLQAQTPQSWYHGLWSRLTGFQPERLAQLLSDRQVVRIALMRSTIHLVTAADCLAIRPLIQPVIERGLSSNFGRNLVGLDPDEVAAAGKKLVDEQPRTFSEMGRLLAEQWPDRDKASLGQAVRTWVPLVQVPPRGVWGKSGRALHTSAEAWLAGTEAVAEDAEAADAPPMTVDELVMRYLTAFGPATVMDAQTWSGLTRFAEVFERLRPRLRTFRDESDRELFDLPDAPRPDPDTPAPVRFLYDYDNLLLSHADRSRVITDGYRWQQFQADNVMPQIVLVDGMTAGTWKINRSRASATLTVRPFTRLAQAAMVELAEEAESLFEFAAAGATTRDMQFRPYPSNA